MELPRIFSTLPKPDQEWTSAQPTSIGSKIVQFPLVRIIIIPFFLALVLAPANLLTMYGIERLPDPYYRIVNSIKDIAVFFLLLWGYRLYVRLVERRQAVEISRNHAFLEFGSGFLLSFLFVGFMVSVMAVSGAYHITGLNSPVILLNSLFLFGIGALIQEIVFRLVLFRLLEELFGTWGAFVFVSLFFGLVHSGNDNATAWSIVALILADVLLASSFILTRRI